MCIEEQKKKALFWAAQDVLRPQNVCFSLPATSAKTMANKWVEAVRSENSVLTAPQRVKLIPP